MHCTATRPRQQRAAGGDPVDVSAPPDRRSIGGLLPADCVIGVSVKGDGRGVFHRETQSLGL